MGFAKGKARFPFALFWFLLQEQKKRPGGEPYKLSHHKGFATPCQLLAAARSRRGSDMPPAYHSLPRRHFVTLYTREPNLGRGEWDAEPSAACGRCSEAEHPQRSKKSSKRAARRFFRAPQGGRSGRWICPAAGGDGNGNLRKTEQLEGGYYGKEKRAGEGAGRPFPGQ